MPIAERRVQSVELPRRPPAAFDELTFTNPEAYGHMPGFAPDRLRHGQEEGRWGLVGESGLDPELLARLSACSCRGRLPRFEVPTR